MTSGRHVGVRLWPGPERLVEFGLSGYWAALAANAEQPSPIAMPNARCGYGKNEYDSQQRTISKPDSGRCWASDVLSQMDNFRGDAGNESG